MPREAAQVEQATYTIEEFATILGVGRNATYEMIRTIQLPLPIIKLGSRIVVPRAAVRSLAGGEDGPADEANRHE